MDSFFSFLLSLLTFGWLRDRQGSVGNVDNWSVMLALKGDCEHCDDIVYFDTFAVEWKHLSDRRVMRQGHKASPIDTTPPVDYRAERRSRLEAIGKQIASLTAASDRLALAGIPDTTAEDAMDRINGQIVTLTAERDRLQIDTDLQTAADIS